MRVKIKKLHPDAVIPTYAKEGDAGMDLTAVSTEFDDNGNMVCHTGIAVEIPKGYVGLVFPRSSIADKDISLTNCVGVIDSGYRGEITAKFKSQFRLLNPIIVWWYNNILKKGLPSVTVHNNWLVCYNVGDRIAQLIIMPYPHVEFEEVEELSQTERGEGGYGSSGK